MKPETTKDILELLRGYIVSDASRLFLGIGGGIVLTGLILFLVRLPAILMQAGTVRTPESLLDLTRSLGWGWYISMIGTGLILVISLFRSRPG